MYTHPEYRRHQTAFQESVRSALPIEVPQISAWLDKQLGWNDLAQLSRYLNKIELTKKSTAVSR